MYFLFTYLDKEAIPKKDCLATVARRQLFFILNEILKKVYVPFKFTLTKTINIGGGNFNNIVLSNHC